MYPLGNEHLFFRKLILLGTEVLMRLCCDSYFTRILYLSTRFFSYMDWK